jgi:hypothetical protein
MESDRLRNNGRTDSPSRIYNQNVLKLQYNVYLPATYLSSNLFSSDFPVKEK